LWEEQNRAAGCRARVAAGGGVVLEIFIDRETDIDRSAAADFLA
jgi:hypothetical protein